MTMVRQAEAVGVEPSALGRKRPVSSRTTTRGAFGVRSVVFAIGGMSSSARRRLAARFRSELAAVRALLKKAAGGFLAPGAGGESGMVISSSSPPSPAAPCGGGRKDGRFLVAAGIRSGGAPAVEAGSENSGKKRKVSFLLERTDASKEMAPDGRKRLAGRPAPLSVAEPPAQIGELLERNRHGSSGEAEIEVHSMDDAALLEFRQKLDKFTEEAGNHGHGPMDASAVIQPSPPPRQRQAADSKIGVEEEEDVDICGGASPSPLFPDVDFSELVGATGVKLLSPLQRKYIALAERANACGGGAALALSSLLPAGYSDLVGATGLNQLSPLPREHVALAERVETCGLVVSPTATTTSPSLPPGFGELADASEAKMLSPLPRKYVALAERGIDVCAGVASTATTLPSLFHLHNELADATGVKMLSPLSPKYVALAEDDDEYVDICGDASPAVIQKNHGEIAISNNSSSPSSDSNSDSNSSSSSSSSSRDSDSGASATGTTPAPAIPNNACVSSAQPSSAPAAPEPEVGQSAKKQGEKLPDQRAAAAAAVTAPPKPLTDLITRAQGAAARRRQDEKAQAREKARQELREMERKAPAMTSNVIHPLDMKLLGLAAVEYMVSSDEEVRCRTRRSAAPSLVEKLGLFLKADDGGDKVQRQQQQQQSSFVAGGGDDDDVEEGGRGFFVPVTMLEKMGLPPKPFVRGTSWVVNATHCQGCSVQLFNSPCSLGSHFLFVASLPKMWRFVLQQLYTCTQERMVLRGQGDLPVRICDVCKNLEEAARYELRYGHKNRGSKANAKAACNLSDGKRCSRGGSS
uniref:Uncharacterized protein n=1 Tax=Oryza punctata TaxID=4537 RepID=A0A0E0K1P0_ORYPU